MFFWPLESAYLQQTKAYFDDTMTVYEIMGVLYSTSLIMFMDELNIKNIKKKNDMAQKIAFIMPVVIMWRRSRSSAVLKIQFRFLFKSGYLLSNPYPFYNKKK